MIGVLLPTRGRYVSFERSLSALCRSDKASLMEVIIVADEDQHSIDTASNFPGTDVFGKYKLILSKERLYSVSAFNLALSYCESDIFVWVTNRLVYSEDWLTKVFSYFKQSFIDNVGVLSFGGKLNKANFGMTSRAFIEHNKGGWFWSGYKINFCDDELACRAILLGRYAFLKEQVVFDDLKAVEEDLLFDSVEQKIEMKKEDRGLFYERSVTNFGLDSNSIYQWTGFREINEELKQEKK